MIVIILKNKTNCYTITIDNLIDCKMNRLLKVGILSFKIILK